MRAALPKFADPALGDARAARWRIALNRHAGTEGTGNGASPGTAALFTTLEAVLDDIVEVIRTPPYYPLDARSSLRIAIEQLQAADACLFGLPRHQADLDPFFLVRDRLARRVPVLYMPLGEFPRGAGTYRHLWRLLGPDDAILFSCSADLAVFRRLVAASPARSRVVPFGIDTARFRRDPERRATIRRHFGLAQEELLLVYHGRVCREKNVCAVLRLVAELVRRELPVRLWVIGPIEGDSTPGATPRRIQELPATPLVAQFARCLPAPRQQERVRFWGGLPPCAVPELLGAADVAINFTLNPDENFGFGVVEAMAAGLPVLGSDWGGLKDTIDPGRTGWRVTTRLGDDGPALDEALALRRAIELAGDPALRERMGRAAEQRARACYGLDCWRRRLCRVIGEQLASTPARAPTPSHAWTALGEELARTYRGPPQGNRPEGLALSVPPFERFEQHPLMREVMATYASDVAAQETPCDPEALDVL